MIAYQDCIQCGKCCERWGWGQKGVIGDLTLWLAANRPDILKHVSIRLVDGGWVRGDDISGDALSHITQIRYWRDPAGRPLRACPFFVRSGDGKALCRIHEVKPRVCREFTPWTWQNNEFYGSCPACREKAP